MKQEVNLIFPHQLFLNSPLLENGNPIYLIEEFLFFRQYKFHKQKLAFHRASMRAYGETLEKKGLQVHYIDATNPQSDIRVFLKQNDKLKKIHLIDPTDNWLEKRLVESNQNIVIEKYPSPLFINYKEDNKEFFRADKKSFFQTSFYKQQRKRLDILIDGSGGPVGGKWSFDADNRKKYPKDKTPPSIKFPNASKHWLAAVDYVHQHFQDNPGELDQKQHYPITHKESEEWLDQFLEQRFFHFGIYEDAIVNGQAYLHHSVLTPMMNVGLIAPKVILDKAQDYAAKNDIPINTLEGFVRQIIGWREFIRGMYELKGSYSRTRNYWNFTRKIPASFYNGTTGILPLDSVIKQILKTGYCHHIERLMILGSFMLLCEFDPDEVYRWFMELFIDAYDWVMVPNVYGMSQFADGGTFATKPYISGSNYLKKMSNYSKGDWQATWDGLFWRFMSVQRDTFSKNPRLSMLMRTLDKMPEEKRAAHMEAADNFINAL